MRGPRKRATIAGMARILLPLAILAVTAAALSSHFGFLSWTYWQEAGGTATSRSEVLRNVGLLAAGVIGLGFGVWRAWTAHQQAQASQSQAEAANEQARIAEQGQITDRFSTAAERLGSDQRPVRIGGIYALWRLAQDSPERDMTSVIDLLCAFVRNPPVEKDATGSAAKLRSDVQAVLNLIGDKRAEYRAHLPPEYFLDFSDAELERAVLRGADLRDVNLRDADLRRADLRDADLRGSVLRAANLKDAKLRDADLRCANFRRAIFTGADLRGAILTGADLRRAILSDADLRRAILSGANLRKVILSGANLRKATLSGADFRSAKNLTQSQLDSAYVSEDGNPPILPEGLNTRPPKSALGTDVRSDCVGPGFIAVVIVTPLRASA